MRILFDSQNIVHKTPFGTLVPGQCCALHIHIPVSVGAVKAECVLELADGPLCIRVPLEKECTEGDYDIFSGSFSLGKPGLYFYYFRIYKPEGMFRLFKQGRDTNMEDGDCWQVSCVPEDFTTPDWAKGAIIYQIFPDRFCKAGNVDLTGKLQPYTVHENWDEEVEWLPDQNGKILNNDFFGGNFRGIAEKMDYIASLGVSIVYLNPICKAFSNHRYDTADYLTPDPMLGTEEDFRAMCQAAHERDIKVVLDGVFSHTGAKSIYFQSACASVDSPYFSWYTFYRYPDSYHSWWGFETLPTVNKMDRSFLRYMIDAEDSVVAYWMGLGADGFRLDVADELPDAFILRLKQRIRRIRPDALLMGEVWEDASNKIAYGIRRRYFADGALDSVMNYPFRTAILDFIRGKDDGRQLKETVMTIAENYPPQVLACNMNLLGSHDTVRILTELEGHIQNALMASFLQYTLPGSPSIYYGDEAGLTGQKDPFNRRTYPWGREDEILINHYRSLGAMRKKHLPLRLGNIRFLQAENGRLVFCREYGDKKVTVAIDRGEDTWNIGEE